LHILIIKITAVVEFLNYNTMPIGLHFSPEQSALYASKARARELL